MEQFPEPTRPAPRKRSATMEMALNEMPTRIATDIHAGIEKNLPTVSESVFVQRIIPILEKIMVPAHRQAYQKVVVDLMMPLRVVDDKDRDKVLHVVPPIARTPRTTIPQLDGGLSVADVLKNMERYKELNRLDIVDDTMRGYLGRITILPDTVQDILLPIHRILQHYGRELDITATKDNPLGRDALPQSADKRGEVQPDLTQHSSCFTEEEDED